MEDWSSKFKGIYVFVHVIPFNNKMVVGVGPILESEAMGAISQKKGKKGQNIWKFGQKCKKIENFLKKGILIGAKISHIKQLEYALRYVCLDPSMFDVYKRKRVLSDDSLDF